jgi:hypothetical protein
MRRTPRRGAGLAAILALAVIAAFGAGGCGPTREPGNHAAALTPARRAQLIRHLRTRRTVTLMPEGTREQTTFHGFVGPCSLWVGYLPQGWITTAPRGCRQLIIRPVFGGKALTTAAVVVSFAPATADSAAACELAVAENLIAWQWRETPRETWTLREADFARWVGLKHTVGRTLVGRHSGRYFWITVYGPLEATDLVLPRFRAILETWTWTDTGEPLDSRRAHTLSGRRLSGD